MTSSRILGGRIEKSTRTRRTFSATKVQTEGKKWRSTTSKLRYYLRVRVRSILGQTTTFQQQETAEIKNRIRAGLDVAQQIQTRADVKIVLLTTQTPLIQHDDHANAELRLWHFGIIEGTRKNDAIGSTKNASPHRPERENTKRKLHLAGTTKMRKT